MKIKLDQSQFIKVLMLTTSDNDHEALSAIRLVNKNLKNSEFKDWRGLFNHIESECEKLIFDYNNLVEKYNNLRRNAQTVATSFIGRFF